MESKKTVRTFALASFLNDLGSDMIYPIWPVFVTTVLGANTAVLGLIDGLGDAIVSISQAISGYVSDRTKKRKIFIWIGYFCGSLSRGGYALSATWQWLIPFKILDRAGKMRGAPRDAIVADVSTKENRGANFGLLRTMDNLGAVCGIIITLLFFNFLGYKNLFLLAAIPSTIAALLIFTKIKEKPLPEAKIYKGLSLKHLDKNLKIIFVLSSIFALGTFSYSFLLLFANHFGFSVATLPILYLIFTAFASLSSLPFGKLSDKIGRKPLLILSFILWGLVSISLIASQSTISIVAAFILYGLHKGAIDTVQKAFVADLAPVEHRAGILGAFQMSIGLCALPASLLAGLLWQKINISTPFYFSLALTILSVIFLMFVKEKR